MATTLTGLTPGATYHVQPVVSNAAYNGVTGPDQTFIAGAPNAITGASAPVAGSNSGQTIYGTVNPGRSRS